MLVCLFLNSHIIYFEGGLGGLPIITYTGAEALPKRVPLSIQQQQQQQVYSVLPFCTGVTD